MPEPPEPSDSTPEAPTRRELARARLRAVMAGALDAATILLAVTALTVAVTGGIRTTVGPVLLWLTSWTYLAAWAGALALVRHVIVSRPSLIDRLARRAARWPASPATRAAVPVFAASRLGVLAVGFLAVVTIGFPPDIEMPFRVSNHPLWNLPVRWDVGWYLGVAEHGYGWDARAGQQQEIAFFPALPLVMRYGGALLGHRPLLAGMIIVLAAFLGALVYLYRLARFDLDHEAASWALVFLASYPFSVFFSVPYTEAIYLVAAVAAVYHLRRREAVRAGLWGLLAGLSRPNGSFLCLPLAVLALEPLMSSRWPAISRWFPFRAVEDDAHTRGRPAVPLLAAAAMPVVGLLLFLAFNYWLSGHPLAWMRAHEAWGRRAGLEALAAGPIVRLFRSGLAPALMAMPLDTLNAAALLFVLVLIWPVARRFGIGYAVFLLVYVVPPFVFGGLLSMGRLTSVLFPLFLWMGAAVPPRHRAAWAASFAMLQGFAAVLFFTWRPLY